MTGKRSLRYRRETVYPVRTTFSLPLALRDALEREAAETERSVAAVVRDALTRGLPLVREARSGTEEERR